jgi:dTDP-glucose pyrophosphorylase/CBS domain-containing protein
MTFDERSQGRLPLVHADDRVKTVLQVINETAKGIALVVNEDQRLLGTITDGDIRRAILAGMDMALPVSELLKRKPGTLYPRPTSAQLGTDRSELLRMMQERRIRQLPLLDEDGRVVDLVMLDDLVPDEVIPVQAVIMAGGLGTRLRPLTDDLPKPMLPVGGRPLMEQVIGQLRDAGIRRVCVSTHYKAEKIREHFGDGRDFGVEISYLAEDQPLGTAGALSLMTPSKEPLLVVNGDILTRVDFRAMLKFHREHQAHLTVGVRQYGLRVPYGVVEHDGPRVTGIREKPLLQFLVNAGIYLLEPEAHRHIPSGQHFDMTDLIPRLLDNKLAVVSFPIIEYWLDIGEHAEYTRAQMGAQSGQLQSSADENRTSGEAG